jgi:hypothetical protein
MASRLGGHALKIIGQRADDALLQHQLTRDEIAGAGKIFEPDGKADIV